MNIQVKICGMKFPDNIEEVALLKPDFLGFIFYENSPRNIVECIPDIDESIQKVGVFVDENFETIMKKVNDYDLQFVQLHGNESSEFCKKLENNSVKVIKSFNIDNKFNFNILNEYNNCCSYFLFDTKGEKHGGNGKTFDWSVLQNYKQHKPYFLSGGIGIDNLIEIEDFFKNEYAKNCIAIDCNSKLETKPGLKSINKVETILKHFKA